VGLVRSSALLPSTVQARFRIAVLLDGDDCWTDAQGKPLNVLNVQVLETDFLGKVTLLGKETISLAELSKCAESAAVAFTLYPRDNGQPLQLTLSVTHVKPTFTLAKVRANQENWN